MTDLIRNPTAVLEQKHLEYVALCASGYTQKEIATAKRVSPVTVARNIAEARDLVGARNIPHLCSLCIESGALVAAQGGGYDPLPPDPEVM